MIARFHGRGAMPVLLAAAAALVIGVSRVFASAYNTVDLPIGNSTGGVYPSGNTYCWEQPPLNFDWGHSLAYSVGNFSNPARIHYKYLDFYGGWTSMSGNFRWHLSYLRHPTNPGGHIPLYAFENQSFYSYDITIWLWTYMPHYSYVDGRFVKFDLGQPNYNCGSLSQTVFLP